MSMNFIRFWKELFILQTCSGSVSFIASTAIIVFIYRNGGLSNPYRRLIFGLSVADLCQSFAIVAGPWLNRSDVPQALWGMGNKHTCRFDGFIFLMGMSAVPMYTLCLCIYYVCKLRDKMTDPQFTTKMEKKMHVIIIVFNLCLYFTALGMDVINSSVSGNFCFAAAMPTGCRQYPEKFGECDPVISAAARFFNIVSTFIIPSVCLIGAVVCLAMIFWNVLVMDKIFGRARNSDSTTRDGGTGNGITKRRNKFLRSMISSCNFTSYNENDAAAAVAASDDNDDNTPPIHHEISNKDSECHDKNDPHLFPVILSGENSKSPKEESNIPITATSAIMDIPQPDSNSQGVERVDRDPQTLSRLYKKELLMQASCYVLIFCISAVPFLIVCLILVSGNAPSSNMVRASAFLYPLSGFFNIIVHTRPNVASLRRTFPNCSRLQAFWLVLKAGGEVPDTTKLSEANVTLWNLGCFFPAGRRKKLHLVTKDHAPKEESSSLPPIENGNAHSRESISALQFGAPGMNGMSMSFGSDIAASKDIEDCHHAEGRVSTLNNIPVNELEAPQGTKRSVRFTEDFVGDSPIDAGQSFAASELSSSYHSSVGRANIQRKGRDNLDNYDQENISAQQTNISEGEGRVSVGGDRSYSRGGLSGFSSLLLWTTKSDDTHEERLNRL